MFVLHNTYLAKTTKLLFVFAFILHKCFCKLVGARGVVAAVYAGEKRNYFVNVFPFNKFCNALKIAVASADKFNVVDFSVFDRVNNLS